MDVNNNQIRFFKNGKDQGIAYRGLEVPQGIYYPALSLFNKAAVRVNFGPSFILKHDIYGANAISELQPLSPEDRRVHEKLVLEIRKERQLRMSQSNVAESNVSSDSLNFLTTSTSTENISSLTHC